MHPVFGLWIGMIVIYLIVTGRAETVIQAWQEVIDFRLKGED
jgi:hypothetical protein